jgi:hypothetical protein
MANSKIKQASNRAKKRQESQGGVAKPRMKGKNSKAPPGNASNSASPGNKGNLNVLNKVKKNGAFKSSKS